MAHERYLYSLIMGGESQGGEGCLAQMRNSRRLVLLIVAIALLLDNMLLTTVVPIVPAYLYQLHHSTPSSSIISTSTTPVSIATLHEEIVTKETPRFLQHTVGSTKSSTLEEIPGYTLVPNEVFWKFRSAITSVQNNVSTTTIRGENTDGSATDSEIQKKILRHEELLSESVEVGMLFASKPFLQAMTNPFIGPLSNRIGYSIPMFVGFIIMFVSTIIFAMGGNYPTMFIARSLQGVGSACTSVAGMGMLAEKYPDDEERGNAMAIALGGLALGVLIGPVFGGAMYEFVGKASPFLVLAGLALVDGVLQLFVLQPKVTKQVEEGTSIVTLLKDPYIIIASGAITFSNLGIACLEPSLPLYMMDTMDATKWQQGAAFLPASISYLIGTNVFGPLAHKMGRWLASMTGLVIAGLCLLCVPMAKSVGQLIPANAGLGFAIGMVDSSMMPMLGYLVDIRHTSVYGSVYAIADVAFCIGFIIGPIFSAGIVRKLGFQGLMYTVAIISFLYAPLMFVLRKPPPRIEIKPVLRRVSCSGVRYSIYTDEDMSYDGGEALKSLKEEEDTADQNCY